MVKVPVDKVKLPATVRVVSVVSGLNVSVAPSVEFMVK